MIFSHEDVSRLPVASPDTMEDRARSRKRIVQKYVVALLRLVTDRVTIDKDRILNDLILKKRALIFEFPLVSFFAAPSLTAEGHEELSERHQDKISFLNVIQETDFLQRLGNILHPSSWGGIGFSSCQGSSYNVHLYADLTKSSAFTKDPACTCEHRAPYEEGPCDTCGGYVVFCWECGAKCSETEV